MRMKLCVVLTIGLCLVVISVLAADDSETPGRVIIGEPEETQIDEFRVNGQLYMIRVTPKKGLPYYLVDNDGDGELESRQNELAPKVLIPSWVLKRW